MAHPIGGKTRIPMRKRCVTTGSPGGLIRQHEGLLVVAKEKPARRDAGPRDTAMRRRQAPQILFQVGLRYRQPLTAHQTANISLNSGRAAAISETVQQGWVRNRHCRFHRERPVVWCAASWAGGRDLVCAPRQVCGCVSLPGDRRISAAT